MGSRQQSLLVRKADKMAPKPYQNHHYLYQIHILQCGQLGGLFLLLGKDTELNHESSFHSNRKKEKNGEAPHYCRLILDGHRAEFSTKIHVRPERWNQKDQLLTGPKSKMANKGLHDIRTSINDLVTELKKNNVGYTVRTFKKYLLEGIGDQIKLSELFNLYISHARTINEVTKTTISK